MNPTELLQRMGETLGATATVKSVFGEPIHVGAKTIVPVARVAYGFGGGVGSGRRPASPDRESEGGGGGGGVRAFPAGVLEITEGTTRFVPYINLGPLALVFAAGAFLGAMSLVRRR